MDNYQTSLFSSREYERVLSSTPFPPRNKLAEVGFVTLGQSVPPASAPFFLEAEALLRPRGTLAPWFFEHMMIVRGSP